MRFALGYLCVAMIFFSAGGVEAVYMAAMHDKLLGPTDTIGGTIGIIMFAMAIPAAAAATLFWVIFGKTWRS